MKRANREMKLILVVFAKKNFVQGKWAILGPKMAHPHNSELALRIFFKFCTMKGADRYMKILLAVFRGKNHLGQFGLFRPFFTAWVGMDSQDVISQVRFMCWILYGYYVMFMCGGQNSGFCKASLRICYVSLFECKGPWMLKTDSLIF